MDVASSFDAISAGLISRGYWVRVILDKSTSFYMRNDPAMRWLCEQT
jgi:hypothetical protein